MKVSQVLAALTRRYGRPAPPAVTDPFGMILYENIAYLVDDARRERVWAGFKKQVGVKPQAILDAPAGTIAKVIKDGGMQPERRAEKVRRAARIALDSFEGDLGTLLRGPVGKARRGLKKFPGIGDPGADKILLFTRTVPVLALDSNGLRVLLRLGFGEASGAYAAQYQSVQEALAKELPRDFDTLIAAHQLLREHGQTLCKRTKPACGECPLVKSCPAAQRFVLERE